MKRRATILAAATLSTTLLAAATTSGSGTATAVSGSSQINNTNVMMSNSVHSDKIADISIQGNATIETSKILAKLPFKVGATFNKALIKEGQKQLEKTDWFRTVTPNVVEYNKQVYVTYTVTENPMINNIVISGNEYVSTEEIEKVLPIKAHSAFNQSEIQTAVQNIQAIYAKKGYFVRILDISLDPMYNLHIVLQVPKLNKVEFKKVVTKDSPSTTFRTKSYVLDREVTMQKGKAIKIKEVQESIANLYQLGIVQVMNPEFKSVKGKSDEVNVVFPTVEKRTGNLIGSVSYGTSIGVVGAFSITDNNFNGMDQTLGLTLQASTQDNRTYMLQFSDPWIKGTKHISFNTSLFKNDYLSVNGPYTSSYGYNFGFGKEFTKNWTLSLSNGLTHYNQFDKDDYSHLLDTYTTYTLTPQITFDTRNNVLNPTRGDYDYFSVTQGYVFGGHGDIVYPAAGQDKSYDYGNLAGGPAFEQAQLSLTKYVPFLWKENFLAIRSIFGVSSPTTPYGSLYNVGGDGSLRGYDSGALVGQREVVFNLENRYNITSWMQGAAFVDAGNATNRVSNMLQLYTDYGVGFRFFTPLGPLRFDFAWPLRSVNNSGNGMHFTFSVGEMF